MRSGLRGTKFLGMMVLASVIAACGKGSSSGASAAPSGGTSTAPSRGNSLTLQERMQAAETTASSDPLCTTLTPF